MKKKGLYIVGAIVLLAAIIAVVCVSLRPSGESGTIPVISLDGECLNDYTNWNDKSTYYPATLTYTHGDETFTKEIEIKPQGTTSLFAPKKNFTVKFADGVEFVEKWGAQEKYVLKADYIDPTCSGNVVSAKLAAEMNKKYGVLTDTPNYGVIDGFPVALKINGEDAGIFNLTIPKDAWLFNMDANNPNHLVLACEGWSEASRMQSADIDYEADWSFEVGEPNEANKAAFERVVKFVSSADDETFVRDFDQYLDLDACLNYICYINAAYATDNVAKNMLMVTYDGKIWYPVLYDLDSLWGINYDGTAPAQVDGAWSKELLSDGNCLLYRVNYFFGDQVRQRYQELRKGILSKANILDTFKAYTAQIPQEYYDINNTLWYADGTQIRTLELMGQLMDEYLPIMDQNMQASTSHTPAASESLPPETGPAPTDGPSGIGQGVELTDPLVHYVWEVNGVQHSLEDIEALPFATTVSYMLDGNPIAVELLAGKSGKVEATLRVERKAGTEGLYGVAAVVQVEEAQCKNLTVTGGTHSKSTEKNVDICMGSAWLGSTDTVYEMRLTMDVTNFDPAKYVVVINPVYVADGGEDHSLDALLATASELTTIINDGINLHTSMVEWHKYLTNIQNSLAAAGSLAGELKPGDNTGEDALAVMKRLLADAEAEADGLLKSIQYDVAADITSEERVKLLAQAAGDWKNSKAEKDQASSLQERIEGYLAVVSDLENSRKTTEELRGILETLNATMPDIADAYAYANDALYSLLYRITTLYQNIANYYASSGGDDAAWLESGDWCDVIIFTNHENAVIPQADGQ